MIFKIVVTPEAERNLRDAIRFIRDDSPRAAATWAKGARKAIRALSRFPDRCPLAPEAKDVSIPIRELFYGTGNRGTYRTLFAMIEKTVFVLHVRHGSMQPLDLQE